MLGTPYYMSPEQCRGASECDPRSDLYSLGCVLFEMLGGRPPYVGEGVGEVLAAHFHLPVPDVRSLRPDVPAPVDALLRRLLAKDPGMRPQSAAAVVAELERLLDRLGAPRLSAAQPTVIADLAEPALPTVAPSPHAAPGSPAPRFPTARLALAGGLALVTLGFAALRWSGVGSGTRATTGSRPAPARPATRPAPTTLPPVVRHLPVSDLPPDASVETVASTDAGSAVAPTLVRKPRASQAKVGDGVLHEVSRPRKVDTETVVGDPAVSAEP
jgi:serine/threonine protein kinase